MTAYSVSVASAVGFRFEGALENGLLFKVPPVGNEDVTGGAGGFVVEGFGDGRTALDTVVEVVHGCRVAGGCTV